MHKADDGFGSRIDDRAVDDRSEGRDAFFIAPRLRYVVDEVLFSRNIVPRGRETDGRLAVLPEPGPLDRSPVGINPLIVHKLIYVYRAELNWHFQLFNETLDGLFTSDIVDEYVSRYPPADGEPLILFLSEYGDDYQFAMDGAREGLGARALIQDKLKVISQGPGNPLAL